MESHGCNLDDDSKAPLIPITQKPYPTPSSAATSSPLPPTLLSSILTLNTLYVLLGPAICAATCLLVRLIGPPSARNMLGILGWVFAWWLTEPVPMPITSMAPLFLFPMFGISTADDVARSYMDDVIALVLGSFILALTVEHNIHRRLALNLNPPLLLLSIRAATAFVSMWMHNVAATVMMMSVATGILQRIPAQSSCNNTAVTKFCKAVVLGVIYSAAIRGMSTLMGTGVNLILDEGLGRRPLRLSQQLKPQKRT